MTKYIISGYIGFDNFGDEAIQKVLIDRLKKEGAEKITLISSNPQKTSELYCVDSCPMLKFFKDLYEADTLISGGGSLLQDVTSLKSLIYYLLVIYSAHFLGKKVEIFAQGIGPINSWFGKILTKYALRRCSKITVRDEKSQELLETWNIYSEVVCDPVFDIELPQKNLKGTIGIQLRNFPTVTNEFLNSLADAVIERFSDKQIKLISLQDSIDVEILEKFEKVLYSKNKNLNIELLKNLSVNDVFETISELEILIGMRFHSIVAAIKAGVKSIAINYDIKIEKLAKEYNLPLIELDRKEIHIQ